MLRIDAHQHFWRYDEDQYPWIGPEKAALKRDYLPEDLVPLLETAGFSGSIAVQARQTIEETEWLLNLALRYPFILGVVGWMDLRGASLDLQLQKYAKHSKLVGVRHVVHDEPDISFMLRPEFSRGLGKLAAHDLAYDLLLFPQHLPVAAEVVGRYPSQTFVLDHIGKPPIQRKEHSRWERDLKALARFKNVSCKLSGMVTEAAWGDWAPQDFEVYLNVVMDAFGPDRLMIGSDWPVCVLSGDYHTTMAIVADYLAAFPQDVKDGIYGGNCARIYGI